MPPDELVWLADAYARLFGPGADPPPPPPVPSSIESVVEAYCKAVDEKWQSLRTQDYGHRLLHYIEPHYSIAPEGAFQDGPQSELGYLPVEPSTADEQELIGLLREAGRLLCMSHDSGMGKTVFTMRVQAAYASSAVCEALNLPRMVPMLFRQQSAEIWPTDLTAAAERQLSKYCTKFGVGQKEIVAKLLQAGRLVFIFDGYDQLDPILRDERSRMVAQFVMETGANCRYVLSGRPYAIQPNVSVLFRDIPWRFAQVRPFHILQQYDYLTRHSPVGGLARSSEHNYTSIAKNRRNRMERVFLDARKHEEDLNSISFEQLMSTPEGKLRMRRIRSKYSDKWTSPGSIEGDILLLLAGMYPPYKEKRVQQLFATPLMLKLFRGLAESGEMASIGNRSKLFTVAITKMMEKAFPAISGHETGRRKRVTSIISAAAFQMMLDGVFDHCICNTLGDPHVISRFRLKVARWVDDDISLEEWDDVQRAAGLTFREVLEVSEEHQFGFRNRSMMEYFCARFLVENSVNGWVDKDCDESGRVTRIQCGNLDIREWLGHDEWSNVWRFALEMPPIHETNEVLAASLSLLFEPVPKSRIRPTQLMYESLTWSADSDSLREDRQRLLRTILHTFQREFIEILSCTNAPTGSFARSRGEIARELKASFSWCPTKTTDSHEFWMGSSDEVGYRSEEPRHRVRVTRFEMQTTTVTREQYRLFDPNFESVHDELLSRVVPPDEMGEPSEETSDRSPIVCVSWYDAQMFAVWLGGDADYRLPTEAQWEFACRAGRDGEEDLFSVGELIDEPQTTINSAQVNFNPKYHEFGEHLRAGTFEENAYRQYAVPVYGPFRGSDFSPNAFGLWHMHGNVWEWCLDDWEDSHLHRFARLLKVRRVPLKKFERHNKQHPVPGDMPVTSDLSRVVLRGGSWCSEGIYCRCAYRLRHPPSFSDYDTGFRLCRVPCFAPDSLPH
ncbi:MAG: SUMF1/EgtB/PvdO family nonheme iron enzyme [Planctomycetaceae bacterium]